MPDLVRLYIRQCLFGFALAGAFVGLLFYLNVANLWHLVSSSDVGLLAAFLLFIFNGIVFSGVQFGIAVMRMAEPEDKDPRGGQEQAILVPIAVDARRPGNRS